jgi:hypothetical protein
MLNVHRKLKIVPSKFHLFLKIKKGFYRKYATRLSNLYLHMYIGWSFKFLFKVGVEKSIVNAPRITDHGLAV